MKHAFTLSEVLITLGIISVVAAMTLPTLVKNYQKSVTVNRPKSVYSILYQAVRRSEVDNGTLDTWDIPAKSTAYEPSKTFATTYFTPYLKNVQECKGKHCLSDVSYDIDGTKRVNKSELYTLVLANGTTIYFFPRGNIVEIGIDINGKQAPNTRGKDKFTLIVSKNAISSDYFGIQDKPGLFFYGQGQSNDYLKTTRYACSKTEGIDYRGLFCGALIMQNGWKIPYDYPW